MLTRTTPVGGVIRAATRDDLPALAALCAAHALFERSGPVPDDLVTRLEPALFTEPARLWCLVAESGRQLNGYATYTREFSTWSASEYVHLDCLFISEPHRGAGWGQLLLDAVVAAAWTSGATEVQWQTPQWNHDAVRFYDRTGARRHPKTRYLLPLAAQEPTDPRP